MRTLPAVLALLVVTAAAAPAAAADHTPAKVAPPHLTMPSNLGDITIHSLQDLHIDRGTVAMPDATGPEDLTWDLQISRTPMRSAHPRPRHPLATATTDRERMLHLGSGEVVCVRGRQHSWGATSAWSKPTCLVRALDDRLVAAHGPVRRMADPSYDDDHATLLQPHSSLRLPRVPDHARYGLVYSSYPLHSPQWCVMPSVHLAGRPHPQGYTGSTSGHTTYQYTTAHTSGTAVYWSQARPTCRVGGVVVIPAWAR